jgi:hypothetical protein
LFSQINYLAAKLELELKNSISSQSFNLGPISSFALMSAFTLEQSGNSLRKPHAIRIYLLAEVLMNPFFKLSDEQLENSLRFYIKKERQILHIILEHIKEMARRELHLKKYSSLVEYLVKEFGYSETAARARMGAAKLLNEVPALAEKIQDGTMNLAKIAELSRAVKEKELVSREKVSSAQKNELVAMISGKTTSQSQQDLARALDIKVKEYEKQRIQQDGSVRHELTTSGALNEKPNRCRSITAHQISQEHKAHTLESTIEIIADLFLEVKEGKPKDIATIEKLHSHASLGVEEINKTVTPKMRRLIIQRDKCCQHKDPSTGMKCGSNFALQVDHITSQWAGGSNSIENLQALCASHNQYKYRKESQLRFG